MRKIALLSFLSAWFIIGLAVDVHCGARTTQRFPGGYQWADRIEIVLRGPLALYEMVVS